MPRPKGKKTKPVRDVVVVSDLHCGCLLGLCPADGVQREEGGRYEPSDIQKTVWSYWEEFWNSWVPHIVGGRPYSVVINGDSLDGCHHAGVHQITANLTAQSLIAKTILAPVAEKARENGGEFYMIRGTEAHVGPSGQQEEALARELGAKPNKVGQHARYDLWLRIGGGLAHILHHIGTTGSQAYEATAVCKELAEEMMESARWGHRPPDCIVRSHRHRMYLTEMPAARGNAFAVVTPAWQAKTPFVWKIPGGRLSTPQFGGIIIKEGEGGLDHCHKVWTIERSEVE